MQRGKAVAFFWVLIVLNLLLFISYYTYQKEVRKTRDIESWGTSNCYYKWLNI